MKFTMPGGIVSVRILQKENPDEGCASYEFQVNTMVFRSCMISGREVSFSSIFTFPLSMRLMSSTSLIRLSKWLLDVVDLYQTCRVEVVSCRRQTVPQGGWFTGYFCRAVR